LAREPAVDAGVVDVHQFVFVLPDQGLVGEDEDVVA
jgi:hypothetical protein